MDMNQMTHYMGLLATNQPWNLIIFMAIPVIMAETLVTTEFFIVFRRLTSGSLRSFNKWLGVVLGLYFTGIFFYLVTTTVPTIEWNTWVDFVAVWAYLLGVVPLLAIALMELGLIFRQGSDEEKMRWHFILVAVFLVVAHVAMIFGMVNPSILSGDYGMKM